MKRATIRAETNDRVHAEATLVVLRAQYGGAILDEGIQAIPGGQRAAITVVLSIPDDTTHLDPPSNYATLRNLTVATDIDAGPMVSWLNSKK